MSENADLHGTGEKRRGDSPAADVASSESKRPRLEDELVASSNAMQENAEVVDVPPTAAEAPMEVEREATASNSTGKAEPPKKRSHRETEPKNKQKGRKDYRNRNAEDAAKAAAGEGEEAGPKAIRYPKRQCSLLMGFCGSGYSGMQMCVGFLYFPIQRVLNVVSASLIIPKRLRACYSRLW